MGFFPELDLAASPCVGCVYEARPVKIAPAMPPSPRVVVVGDGPGAGDEFAAAAFSGPDGQALRDALRAAGLDPVRDVGYAYLERCRPDGDDFDGPAWARAERRCRRFFDADLGLVPGVPLLLLGQRPLKALAGGKKSRMGASRGLWVQGAGRDCFVVRHPRQAVGTPARDAVFAELAADVRRMADRMLGREPASGIKLAVYETPAAAAPFLKRMAAAPGPWAFDIETYDLREFPSRAPVSTDATHPDFGLRGVAFAWARDKGAWVDCLGWEPRMAEARALFAPVFGSAAEKWAFWGHFDDDGLVFPGWVPEVANRRGDGGLALLALSDGTHDSLKLEKAVVDVLGRPQYWNGMDKARMRDVPLRQCAENAVGDACYTFELCELLHARLARGDYNIGRRGERDGQTEGV